MKKLPHTSEKVTDPSSERVVESSNHLVWFVFFFVPNKAFFLFFFSLFLRNQTDPSDFPAKIQRSFRGNREPADQQSAREPNKKHT